ncbi:hypothetical protein BJ912DRAFT_964775 [Pholiota molesta]|nr:hypothetical protein BJ912DRAFT_964775 [Pholiota molesta]
MKSIFPAAIFLVATIIKGHAQTSSSGMIVCPADECFSAPPPCPFPELGLESEGCWRCCSVVCPTTACAVERPICLEDEGLSGFEGCWGCCYPITSA